MGQTLMIISHLVPVLARAGVSYYVEVSGVCACSGVHGFPFCCSGM